MAHTKPEATDADELEALRRELTESRRAAAAAHGELERARQRERAIGTAIQQLLFGVPPPTLSGYEIASYNEPSQGVDGDFHTFTQIGPSGFEVLAGDVMGKGIGAALIAARINDAYRRVFAEMLAAQPATLPAPAAVVNAIHAAMTPQLLDSGTFVTLALLRCDLSAQSLTWVNAGHTPTLLLAAGRDEAGELLGTNLPLGVAASESYVQHGAPFAAGDTLLIYSDGLSEAVDAERNEYGGERIKALLAQRGDASPAQILDRLRTDLHRFTGGAKGTDDRSAIVIRASNP